MFARSPSIRLRSGCKINLFLHIGQRRPDGYHDLESLFLPLAEPGDTLVVFRDVRDPQQAFAAGAQAGAGKSGLRCAFVSASDGSPLPDIDPERNTVSRAYAWYAGQTGFAPVMEVRVEKSVPSGAGLGGGSANAAALLRYLQEEIRVAGGEPLPDPLLRRGAAAIGADVPFFLLDRPARVSGVGEILAETAHPYPGFFLLLVCPALFVSTAWAFAALDNWRKNHPSGLTSTAGQDTHSGACGEGESNDFEAPVFDRYPELQALHQRLLRSGAVLARLTGTGAALFALYREEKIARHTAKILASDGLSVYVQCLPAL